MRIVVFPDLRLSAFPVFLPSLRRFSTPTTPFDCRRTQEAQVLPWAPQDVLAWRRMHELPADHRTLAARTSDNTRMLRMTLKRLTLPCRSFRQGQVGQASVECHGVAIVVNCLSCLPSPRPAACRRPSRPSHASPSPCNQTAISRGSEFDNDVRTCRVFREEQPQSFLKICRTVRRRPGHLALRRALILSHLIYLFN